MRQTCNKLMRYSRINKKILSLPNEISKRMTSRRKFIRQSSLAITAVSSGNIVGAVANGELVHEQF